MNIVYTFNRAFLPQAAASIASVCDSNEAGELSFYLLHTDLNDTDLHALDGYIRGRGAKADFIRIGDVKGLFDFDFDTSGWNPIVLVRLCLEKILPEEVERALYLDGDTIVRGSLESLWNTDMEAHPIAAVPEPTYAKERKAALGLSGLPYCNAGVLLFDLNRCRREHTGDKIIQFLKDHGGKLFANDQDAINGALCGNIHFLPPAYNYCNIYDQYPWRFFNRLTDYPYITEEEYTACGKNPVIIHFLGEERPWRIGNHHRFREDYEKALNETPWKGQGIEQGWHIYFVAWDVFNLLTKPFPQLRYRIITAMIPRMLQKRTKK